MQSLRPNIVTSESTRQTLFLFNSASVIAPVRGKKVALDFNAGNITSDSGTIKWLLQRERTSCHRFRANQFWLFSGKQRSVCICYGITVPSDSLNMSGNLWTFASSVLSKTTSSAIFYSKFLSWQASRPIQVIKSKRGVSCNWCLFFL